MGTFQMKYDDAASLCSKRSIKRVSTNWQLVGIVLFICSV